MPELTATLHVDLFHSWCGNCREHVMPKSATHAEGSGPQWGQPGCGSRFTAIAASHAAVTADRLREIRPDLPVR